MNLDFSNKTIVVTGATRGIGRQIADDLSLLGANLVLTGTNPDQISELNELASLEKKKVKYYCVDLLKRESLENFCAILHDLGRIDGLVNNAGINRLNAVNNIKMTDWDDMLAVNLSSPLQIIKTVSSKMIEQNHGRIINVASIFSKISKEKRAAYSATKFGLNGLTIGISNDLARYNIMVNTLSPGFVMTDLTKKNLSQSEIELLTDAIPTKRMASTKDISNVAVFLLSDLNTYLTGQNIIVDGGFTNV
ncbi:MAG: SDR family oxidoreductase [Sediminibacterium sp.]